MKKLMKMMTIIVWILYHKNSQSYELKKKKLKIYIYIFFNQIFSTDLSQVGWVPPPPEFFF